MFSPTLRPRFVKRLSVKALSLFALALLFAGQALAADMPPMPHTGDAIHAEGAASDPHTAESALTHADSGHAQTEHGSGGNEHHGSGGLPQLDPSTFQTQLFWLLIFFTVLYMVFSKKNLPEISAVVENRRTRIQNDLDAAEKMKGEADTVRQAYEEGIAKAQAQASKYYQEAENGIREKSESQLKAFLEKSQAEIEKSETAIASARQKALADIDDLSAELGRMAAEKIIGVKLDAAKAA